MAKWIHKVRSYHNETQYSLDVYPGTGDRFQNPESVQWKNRKSMEEWLDWQCRNGWELFKFHPDGWCVFRKQV